MTVLEMEDSNRAVVFKVRFPEQQRQLCLRTLLEMQIFEPHPDLLALTLGVGLSCLGFNKSSR